MDYSNRAFLRILLGSQVFGFGQSLPAATGVIQMVRDAIRGGLGEENMQFFDIKYIWPLYTSKCMSQNELELSRVSSETVRLY
jgi:hypothetical protein